MSVISHAQVYKDRVDTTEVVAAPFYLTGSPHRLLVVTVSSRMLEPSDGVLPVVTVTIGGTAYTLTAARAERFQPGANAPHGTGVFYLPTPPQGSAVIRLTRSDGEMFGSAIVHAIELRADAASPVAGTFFETLTPEPATAVAAQTPTDMVIAVGSSNSTMDAATTQNPATQVLADEHVYSQSGGGNNKLYSWVGATPLAAGPAQPVGGTHPGNIVTFIAAHFRTPPAPAATAPRFGGRIGLQSPALAPGGSRALSLPQMGGRARMAMPRVSPLLGKVIVIPPTGEGTFALDPFVDEPLPVIVTGATGVMWMRIAEAMGKKAIVEIPLSRPIPPQKFGVTTIMPDIVSNLVPDRPYAATILRELGDPEDVLAVGTFRRRKNIPGEKTAFPTQILASATKLVYLSHEDYQALAATDPEAVYLTWGDEE